MGKLTYTVSVADTELFKDMLSTLVEASIALNRIAQWDELSIEQRVDIGTLGQIRHYRQIAMDALENIKNLA